MLTAGDVERIKRLLENLKLPVTSTADPARMIEVIRKDKKRESDIVYFVLLDGIGHAVVEAIPFDELGSSFEHVFGLVRNNGFRSGFKILSNTQSAKGLPASGGRTSCGVVALFDQCQGGPTPDTEDLRAFLLNFFAGPRLALGRDLRFWNHL